MAGGVVGQFDYGSPISALADSPADPHTASMPVESNFTCQSCGARLLAITIEEAAQPGEEALCPHCGVSLPPRDGAKRVYYKVTDTPPVKLRRPRDLNAWAKRMVDIATGDAQETTPDDGKEAAAVSLGRRGGPKAAPESMKGATVPPNASARARSGSKATPTGTT